jgi:hypothetical protein
LIRHSTIVNTYSLYPYSSTGNLGGAVLGQNAIINISSSLLRHNEGQSGGAVSAITSTITLTNTTMSDNTASQGSGIFFFGDGASQESSLIITNSTFLNNTATQSGCISVGDHVQLVVQNTVFDGNACGTSGAAVTIGSNSTAMFNKVCMHHIIICYICYTFTSKPPLSICACFN